MALTKQTTTESTQGTLHTKVKTLQSFTESENPNNPH